MLGLKYVVAKSKELQVKLEQRAGSGSNSSSSTVDVSASPSSRYSARAAAAPSNSSSNAAPTADVPAATTHEPSLTRSAASPTSSRNEGELFLALQQKQWDTVLTKHEQLLASGEQLSDALASARKKLQDQTESERFISQHFHQITRVREQITRMRGLVAKIAEDAEDVEQFLVQKTEEYMAAQNASFAARQQVELELFEERILGEKEELKRQLLEDRRAQLARAFQNDLKTYQTLVTYQGDTLAKTVVSEESYTPETLESIDLIVTADAQQLNAFYESSSSDDDEEEETKDSEGSDATTGAMLPDATQETLDTAAATVATDVTSPANATDELVSRVEISETTTLIVEHDEHDASKAANTSDVVV